MKYALALLLLICSPFAFGGDSTDLQPAKKEALFSISGSNTIGARLAPAWAKAFLESKGADRVQVTPGANENEYRVEGRLRQSEVHIDIFAHGSSTGFASLANGQAQIAMASRAIKTDELERLAHLGNLSEFAAESVVAIDGLAVITHPGNPVKSLSVDQIAKIFSGQIVNWNSLGGEDLPIELFARDSNSGTWDTFHSLVLKNHYTLSNQAQRLESNDQLSDLVSNNPRAIGFVGLASIRKSQAIAIVDGGSDALLPQPLFVATEDYPLSRRLYLYTPASTINSLAHEFVLFTQHTLGQELVEKIGFISQNPIEMEIKAEGGSEYYQALTQNALRLSLNFRFQPGRSELDNKAKRDIQRLAEYFKKPQNHNLHIQLIGFSDQETQLGRANILSKLRATAVKVELFNQGITTESIEGFGAERPLASLSAKNDRVEIWVYPANKAVVIEKLKRQHSTAAPAHLLPLELVRQ